MAFHTTNIEYLTHVWNPITMQCTPCSPGCAHCWHLRRAKMLANNLFISPEKREIYAGNAAPQIFPKDLHVPKGKGRRIGVQLMGDLYHPSVSSEMRKQIFEAIQEHPKDDFFILTKRPENISSIGVLYYPENILWGISAEDQRHYDERWEILKKLPKKFSVLDSFRLFISAEPLLGPIELRPWGKQPDWLVVGAETGPGKRYMDIMWAVDLLAQCKEVGIPFFMKKLSDGTYDPKLFKREYPNA